MSDIKTLLAKMISFPSITPQDAGCQDFMLNFFKQYGFTCQRFNNPPVTNFFARIGNKAPLLVFAGHTDVVPVGDESKWHSPPFALHEKDGLLYGRGSADMKGSLAAMMVMAAEFITKHPRLSGSLGFLITSGEEGDDFNRGTPYVMEQLYQSGVCPNFCVVGEPSSANTIADTIRIGRRGSLTGKLILTGIQGHVAYPHLAKNPIHLISPALTKLINTQWDYGNSHFPPTSLQITHIQAGGHAGNIIPGELSLQFNFRYSTEQNAEQLQKAVIHCFQEHGLTPTITWQLNGAPFLTAQGELIKSSVQAIKEITDYTPEHSTGGGTSDGRFIAPYGVEVIELGPLNQTIHQVNECVSLADLEVLKQIYYRISELLLINADKNLP